MTTYVVESFHISVGVGDCAVHLLVERANQKNTIRSAVLVDAGSAHKNKLLDSLNLDIKDKSAFRRAVTYINTCGRYSFGKGKKVLEFDSIVITHWDEDHHGALFKTLQEDVEIFSKVPYLKYEKSIPRTVFYAPNGVKSTDLNGPPDKRVSIVMPNTEYASISVKNAKGGWVGVGAFRAASWGDNTKIYNVLGVNFFNNKPLKLKGNKRQSVSLEQLLEKNPPTIDDGVESDSDVPGMYCIGVMEECLDGKGEIMAGTPSGGARVQIVPERVTKTNRVSIAAAILWITPIRCSHYFAGDAHQLVEQAVLDWLKAGGIKYIPTMKMSHHGSRSSTPVGMIRDFMPKSLIASNPTGRYFHPGWEVILCYAVWARQAIGAWAKNERESRVVPHVYALKYPFFLNTGNDGTFTLLQASNPKVRSLLNSTAFDLAKDKHFQGLRDFLAAGFAGIFHFHLQTTYFEQYHDLKASGRNGEKRAREYIMEVVTRLWNAYCFPSLENQAYVMSTEATGAEIKGAFIQFLHVMCTKKEDSDGRVTFKRFGENEVDSVAWRMILDTHHVKWLVANLDLNRTVYQNPEAKKGASGAPFKKLKKNNGDQLSATQYDFSRPDRLLRSTESIFHPDLYTFVGENEHEMDHDEYYDDGVVMGDSQDQIPTGHPWMESNAASHGAGEVAIPDRPRFPALAEAKAGCFLFSSTSERFHDVNPSFPYHRMDADSAWDCFIDSLHCSMLCTGADDWENGAGSLELVADEFACWLADVVAAEGVMVFKTPNSKAPAIRGFEVKVALPTPSQPDTPLRLLFTTESTAMARQFRPDVPPDMGLRDGETALTLALDSTKTQGSISLSDLAKFLGLNYIFSRPFLGLLGSFKLSVSDADEATQPGQRSAIWFVPQSDYRTVLRLRLVMTPESRANLQNFFDLLGKDEFVITDAYAIARSDSISGNTAKYMVSNTVGSLTMVLGVDLVTPPGKETFPTLKFRCHATFQQHKVRLGLVLNSTTTDALQAVLHWLERRLGFNAGSFDFTSWLREKTGFLSFGSIDLRQISIELVPKDENSQSGFRIGSFSLSFQVTTKVRDQQLLFLVTYTYTCDPQGTFLGNSALDAQIWLAPDKVLTGPDAPRLLPDYEDFYRFEPVGADPDWPTAIDLRKLAGLDDGDRPSELPTLLRMAHLTISNRGIEFTGALQAPDKPPPDGSSLPRLALTDIELCIAYDFDSKLTSLARAEGKNGFRASIDITARIQPPEWMEGNNPPASLGGLIQYDKGAWTFGAWIDTLPGAYLVQFFSKDVQPAAAALLSGLVIDSFEIGYKYAPNTPDPSSFKVAGVCRVGPVRLSVDYIHNGNPWTWYFVAMATLDLNQDVGPTTFGTVLDGLAPGAGTELPDFVRDITIRLDDEQTKTAIGLALMPDEETKTLTMTFYVQVGGFKVQYVQLKNVVSQEPRIAAAEPPRRILLAGIAALPKVEVALVGDITQPFDEALFAWVPGPKNGGWKKEEADKVNSVLDKKVNSTVLGASVSTSTAAGWDLKPLRYKTVKKTTPPDDLVIKGGLHLMLVLKDAKGASNVVVDYVFGKDPPPPKQLTSGTSDDQAGDSSSMAPYPKSQGPISIRNMGFEYADKTLSVKMDASVVVGPLAFDLLGFSLGLAFTKGFSLDNPPAPRAHLGGLAISYERSPLLVGGMFRALEQGDAKMYQGAAAISYQPWLFGAAGFYGEVGRPDKSTYKTAFLYAMLDGPLITFSFGQISGVTAGFGYNTAMRFPPAAEVTRFPFLSRPRGADDPEKTSLTEALGSIVSTGWVMPKDGGFWIAAGLKVKAFQMLEVQAVAVVEWGTGLRLGIFAVATADMPPQLKPEGGMRFAHVELGLTATLDVDAGTLCIDGQLAPSSFILAPACRLSGGFALYSWFGEHSALKGDWVFTLGGYHRQYTPPPQYPAAPRLAIAWQFSNAISIRGEAYFAITPAVCMGGGRWNVSLQLGPLEAFYEAYVDFLINFQPFHFVADGGISVGVRFVLDLWLVTLHISVDIAATLQIEGPPIRGTVHVYFWVFGFDVDFGGDHDNPPGISMDEMVKLACEKSQGDEKASLDTIAASTPLGSLEFGDSDSDFASSGWSSSESGLYEEDSDSERNAEHLQLSATAGTGPHVLSVESGLVPSGKAGSNPNAEPWVVQPVGFAFNIACKIPVDGATIVTEGDCEKPEVKGSGKPIFAKPMKEDGPPISSVLTVTIRFKPAPADKLLEPRAVPLWENNRGIIKKMPTGLWGKYSKAADPAYNANNRDLLDGNKDATVDLLAEIRIAAPNALPAELDTLQPFDYKRMFVSDVEDETKSRSVFPCPYAKSSTRGFLPAPVVDRTGQWAAVVDAWREPRLKCKPDEDAISLWKGLGLGSLGWEPEKLHRDEFAWPSSGKPGPLPELLGNFDSFYLWPPYLSRGDSRTAA